MSDHDDDPYPTYRNPLNAEFNIRDPFDHLDPEVQRYYEKFGELPGVRNGLSAGSSLIILAGLGLFFFDLATHVLSDLLNALVGLIARNKIELEVSIVFGVALLIVASVAYRLRCRDRTLYGTLEVAFGVLSIYWASRELFSWLIAGGSGDPQFGANAIIPSVAGLYIIVGGFTNIEEGKAMQSHLVRKSKIGKSWNLVFHAPWIGR
jgi:hypothetical protein